MGGSGTDGAGNSVVTDRGTIGSMNRFEADVLAFIRQENMISGRYLWITRDDG